MISISHLVTLTHLVGLALGVGAATVKLVLLFRCRSDPALLPAYLAIVRPVTRLIISGLILLTVSGIAWILLGMSFTPLLVVKSVLVLLLWVLGPIIDKVAEPRFAGLAPSKGTPASPMFIDARNRYLALETVATTLFYAITIMGVAL